MSYNAHFSLDAFVSFIACTTYVNTIKHIETPGTHLHKAWADIPAPPMAIGYYHLPKDAKWVDTLKCMVRKQFSSQILRFFLTQSHSS